MGHRVRGQPARVQPLGARVRHRHARPFARNQRRARLRRVEDLRFRSGPPPRRDHVPRGEEGLLLQGRIAAGRRQIVRDGSRLGGLGQGHLAVRADGQAGEPRLVRAVPARRRHCRPVHRVLLAVREIPLRLSGGVDSFWHRDAVHQGPREGSALRRAHCASGPDDRHAVGGLLEGSRSGGHSRDASRLVARDEARVPRRCER